MQIYSTPQIEMSFHFLSFFFGEMQNCANFSRGATFSAVRRLLRQAKVVFLSVHAAKLPRNAPFPSRPPHRTVNICTHLGNLVGS